MRVDSGLEAGSEVTPLYDPMVAKLIVWDVDREKATARMLRALGEYRIEPLTTLIPFHQAILATEQWANGETCRDLTEDKKWLKHTSSRRVLRSRPGGSGSEEDDAEKVERTYSVEVDGRLHAVKVIGAAAPTGGAAADGAPAPAEARALRRRRRGRERPGAALAACRARSSRSRSRRAPRSRRGR